MTSFHLLVAALVLAACGDPDGTDAQAGGTTANETGGATANTPTNSTTAGSSGGPVATQTGTTAAESSGAAASTGSTSAPSATSGSSSGEAIVCDYETVDGLIVIEAESLAIAKDWTVVTTEPGYYAEGYIDWTGAPHDNDPTHGVISVTLFISNAGRYRLQWRNRIGVGTEWTLHNDTWVKFSDADGFYGVQISGDTERRQYPRPECEDADAMAAIEALPAVSEAVCVEGSSTDGWLKVYSSGASDWLWSTFTNDNDGSNVVAEFDAPGAYTLMLAARSTRHLIDRLVIHEEAIDDAVVRDENNSETLCPQ